MPNERLSYDRVSYKKTAEAVYLIIIALYTEKSNYTIVLCIVNSILILYFKPYYKQKYLHFCLFYDLLKQHTTQAS